MENNIEPKSCCCKKKNGHSCPCTHKPKTDGHQPEFWYLLRSDFSEEIFLAYFSQDNLEAGNKVVCRAPYGLDILNVLGLSKACANNGERDPIAIQRVANKDDLEKLTQLEKRRKEAVSVFQQNIKQYPQLEIKFVHARFLLDETKIIFFFTAEERVDFREFVKVLSFKLQIRVELWQINSREETRILGGLAICGREYCCKSTGVCASNISMKMLKDQMLSPNSAKLSGACGRLFCCLAYEHQQYIDEKKTLPKVGNTVVLDDEKWQVREINVIARSVTLVTQTGGRLTMSGDDLSYERQGNTWISNIRQQEED